MLKKLVASCSEYDKDSSSALSAGLLRFVVVERELAPVLAVVQPQELVLV